MKERRIGCLFLMIMMFSTWLFTTSGKEAVPVDYWPTNGWRLSTPERQGMNSGTLADMLSYIRKEKITIDSITVVRNGYLVLDAYLHPLYKRGSKHIIHSCTKSITSTLMGIAIEKGYVTGINQQLVSIFPEKEFDNPDLRKDSITIQHLLTMSHGIRTLDSFLYNWKGLSEMWPSKDWVQYILDLPMDEIPGERYDYSNMGSFLLSAIIQRKTGANAFAFARTHLFDPLGIRDIKWASNTRGETTGWGGIWMKPVDMAKFGWLYLNNGYWDGQQIVPAEWIKESTRKHTFPRKYRKVFDKNGEYLVYKSAKLWTSYNLWMPFTDGYGYQWWIDNSGAYSAIGYGGQYIMVIPEQRMVVVFTSVLGGRQFSIPGDLLKSYIMPSILSNRGIPPGPSGYKRLVDQLAMGDEGIDPEPVPALNETAKRISGKSYRLEENKHRYRNLSLTFEPESKTAHFDIVIGFNVMGATVGLDNTYRISRLAGRRFAAKGRWISNNTFEINFDYIGFTSRGTIHLTFDGDNVTYAVQDNISGKTMANGRME